MTSHRFDRDFPHRKTARLLSGLVLCCLITGCAAQAGYETVQNARDLQCQQNLSASCPERESYDSYRRKLQEHEASQ